ncbi:MAG: VanZ family protein [Marinilabiliaceae bacterium]|nr:VanZ family protein [Marinilabiliaceae bacterium]
MNTLLKYHKTITILIAITLLSLLNVGEITPNEIKLIPHSDKIVHFTMYFTATFVLLLEYFLHHKKNKAALKRLTVIPFIWGGIMEICQFYLTENRGAEWWDLAANTCGLLFGYLIFMKVRNNHVVEYLITFPFKGQL